MQEPPDDDIDPLKSTTVDDPQELERPAVRLPRVLRGVLAVGLVAALTSVIWGASRDGAELARKEAITTVDGEDAAAVVDDRDSRNWPASPSLDEPPSTTAPGSAESDGSISRGPSGSQQAAENVPVDLPDTPVTEPAGPENSNRIVCVEEAAAPFHLDWRPPSLPAEGTVMYLEWRTGGSIQSSVTLTHENSEITRMGGAPNHFMLGAYDGHDQWFGEFAPGPDQDLGCGSWRVDGPGEPPILRVTAGPGCTPNGAGGFVVDSHGPSEAWNSDIELRFTREGCGTQLFGYVRYDADDRNR